MTELESVPGEVARDLLHDPEMLGIALLQWAGGPDERRRLRDGLLIVQATLEGADA